MRAEDPPSPRGATTDDEVRERLRTAVRNIPDFPKQGILFRDITTLLLDPEAHRLAVEAMAEPFRDSPPDQIVGIESRGFIFGAAVANRLSLPLHLVRKQGKLPRATIGIDYALEYGTDRVELHRDALSAGTRYAIVDDVLATGGTTAATVARVRQQQPAVAQVAAQRHDLFLAEVEVLVPRPVQERIPERVHLAQVHVRALEMHFHRGFLAHGFPQV